ncbi:hypothetical protein [Candidatus Desulfosporosinus nitrosoreducens]|uniref:hypothetical protein n=1 Tax=Candidatus Desulfosporosinus nitrosoreducens TaxID=3401928 RepID=UPI00280BB078|nr:hypothetical protein [Desulfosporosinus sp. PR]
MWSNSTRLMMVRIKVKNRRGLAFPVAVWVIDEFMDALTDLAWVGEVILRCIPLPKDEKSNKALRWVKAVPFSGLVAGVHGLIKGLSGYNGLDLVDVETENIKVSLSLK